MGRPQADYKTTFNNIVRELGVGKRIEMTAPEIAQLIDEPPGRVLRTLDVMKRADSLKLDYITRPGVKGRISVYTVLTSDFAATEARMKERGIAWSSKVEDDLRDHKPKRQNGVVKSFADISTLRKSEPRAELEVARKYRDQKAFIEEQRRKFQEMGLVMPEPASMYDEMRIVELEAVVRIIPYVESIEKANENLSEQNRLIRQPQAELNDAKRQITAQREQIERMVREKSEVKEDVQKMLDDHKREMKALRDENEELKGQLRRIRGNGQIDAAIAVHEVRTEAAKQTQ